MINKKPCKKEQFFKYSPQWAMNISEKLLGRYARASEILAEQTGINMDKIWMYLATNSIKWVIIRNLIHKAELIRSKMGEEMLIRAIKQCPTTQLLSGLESNTIDISRFSTAEDLTELLCWLNLKGQGFKGSKGL